jgi:hypothetical protein
MALMNSGECSGTAFEGYGIIPFIDEEDEYFLSLFKF